MRSTGLSEEQIQAACSKEPLSPSPPPAYPPQSQPSYPSPSPHPSRQSIAGENFKQFFARLLGKQQLLCQQGNQAVCDKLAQSTVMANQLNSFMMLFQQLCQTGNQAHCSFLQQLDQIASDCEKTDETECLKIMQGRLSKMQGDTQK